MVGGGETTDGMEAEPGGAPVFTAAFSVPASCPVVESLVAIGPMKVWVAGERVGCSIRGPSRRKSRKSSSVKGSGWTVGMGLEGGDTSPPKPIPGVEGSFGAKPQGRMR